MYSEISVEREDGDWIVRCNGEYAYDKSTIDDAIETAFNIARLHAITEIKVIVPNE